MDDYINSIMDDDDNYNMDNAYHYWHCTKDDPIPDSVRVYDCSDSELTEFTLKLPRTLKGFNCGKNYLEVLPELPESLRVLNCWGNKLATLPEVLPKYLIELYCSDNILIALSALPKYLKILTCNNNRLTELPELPSVTLIELYCLHNELQYIPALSEYLETFDCSYNKLVELPELPRSIEHLECNNNNIKYLSRNNIEVITNIRINFGCELEILNNPVSAGFTKNSEFQAYLDESL